MSIMFNRPIKFQCVKCNKIYLGPYQGHQHQYLHCPHCQSSGQLLGFIDPQDWLKHPIHCLQTYLKQSWHKLNNTRSPNLK